MFEELTWERKRSITNSLCRIKTRIILGGGPEADHHHQRQVRDPVETCQPRSKRGFQRTLKLLNHSVTLRVEASSQDPPNPEDGKNL